MKRGNVSEKEPSDHKRLEEEKEREREKIPNGHWFLNLKESRGWGGGGGMNWEIGIDIYTLIYIR